MPFCLSSLVIRGYLCLVHLEMSRLHGCKGQTCKKKYGDAYFVAIAKLSRYKYVLFQAKHTDISYIIQFSATLMVGEGRRTLFCISGCRCWKKNVLSLFIQRNFICIHKGQNSYRTLIEARLGNI
jgi:hypothetical protein